MQLPRRLVWGLGALSIVMAVILWGVEANLPDPNLARSTPAVLFAFIFYLYLIHGRLCIGKATSILKRKA